ncbi:MAG: hypothetical protein KAS16_05380 [Thermoplasmata archaeon]|nr:hypothetical protein [Thermoplasmata archaeon]
MMEKAFVATLIALSFIALGASSMFVLGTLNNGILGIGHMGMMYDDGNFGDDHGCYEYGEAHEYCEENYETGYGETSEYCEEIGHEHYDECEDHMHYGGEYGSGYYSCH